ncbi:malto-oligosyltrehalose trehalohydrolase [Rathayibacter toxicus]|uniref:Malto-oligosyltrehalose trehalohydrolase n=1 Tax=Rathayibacter toxicus TaxID=145458 RepID=A0A2S5Y7C9_9MICO|nr:malto-oligosyltrehalose trehalohydrolase [Rathayibacter toxicus]PPH23845.1 malto-oligosyltrehalose trehalohydrolase [Rathayibacter toxicus]PPH57654.1 malto-oligosyltrehalose trehalohydrolase [Rathayibacter toxicus]PPH60149.1 malto-oligosyltrehalose trehalohydrolase [Rathayibacter toxicus]PPH87606.1 malto-oligosyltrehalose trehalohydrolase [Rathayibacter toxicus]PPI15376.1 malto-oligosyltrehalose trehalohydrolase [Rathayibacter toxicus]
MTCIPHYRHALPVTGAARFDVWAPAAASVELIVGSEESHALTRIGPEGWWRAPVSAPASGQVDYGYRIDGNGPFPDPRSRWQPQGVHDLSRTFDPAQYQWADTAWTGRQLAGAVIYELHIGTFTPEGTLDAAAAKLDHLRSIGVDYVELLPVNAFNGTHNWGYDGVLWYAVHEPYGGPEAYQRFVDAAHRIGIGVVQDVVYNHFGPSGNYLPEFGPYLRSEKATTWGSSINLDGEGSDVVRDYIIDNALMWLRDYHVDALRLDAVHALSDGRAVHLLEELAEEISVLSDAVGRPLTLIAESDLNDPRLITSREAGGYGLDAQWSDDFHHAVHVALTGEVSGYYEDFAPLGSLVKVLTQGFFHDGTLSTFRGRHHGRPLNTERMPTWRLVVCSQNHDQIGNRATGDRLAATLDEGRLAIAAALTLLGPFTPMLFMGEEWGASTPWQFFTSHSEKDLGEVTAKGRIHEFARMGWDPKVVPDPQDPATFLRSRLDWSEAQEGRHARILAVYRELAILRRRFPELTDPRFSSVRVECDEQARWLTLSRGRVTMAINVGEQPATVPLPAVAEVLLGVGAYTVEFGATGTDLGASSLLITLSTAV